MRFLQLEVLRQQISEFSQTLASDDRSSMLEINNFFKVSKSTPIVNVIIFIAILPLKRNVVKHKFTALRRKSFSGDAIGVFIFLGTLDVLFRSGLHRFLLDHKQRIISRDNNNTYKQYYGLFSTLIWSSVEYIFREQRTWVWFYRRCCLRPSIGAVFFWWRVSAWLCEFEFFFFPLLQLFLNICYLSLFWRRLR